MRYSCRCHASFSFEIWPPGCALTRFHQRLAYLPKIAAVLVGSLVPQEGVQGRLGLGAVWLGVKCTAHNVMDVTSQNTFRPTACLPKVVPQVVNSRPRLGRGDTPPPRQGIGLGGGGGGNSQHAEKLRGNCGKLREKCGGMAIPWARGATGVQRALNVATRNGGPRPHSQARKMGKSKKPLKNCGKLRTSTPPPPLPCLMGCLSLRCD